MWGRQGQELREQVGPEANYWKNPDKSEGGLDCSVFSSLASWLADTASIQNETTETYDEIKFYKNKGNKYSKLTTS